MEIRYAIFDMDGTIVDSLCFWEYKWREFGEKYLGQENYVVPADLDNKLRVSKLCECAAIVKNSLSIDVSDEEIYTFFNGNLIGFYKNCACLKKGAKDLLRYLKSIGVKNCLATATEGKIALEVTKFFGIDKYFDYIVSCCDPDVNSGKENTKIFKKSMKLMDADAKKTFVFEDSVTAVCTAKKLGVNTVGVFDKHNADAGDIKMFSDLFIADGDDMKESFIKQMYE